MGEQTSLPLKVLRLTISSRSKNALELILLRTSGVIVSGQCCVTQEALRALHLNDNFTIAAGRT